MSFWNQAFYFEKRGHRYVYRPTAFSAGFDISESEKDQLFAGLKRLQWRMLWEGILVICLIALVFMTGTVKTETPIHWFMVSAVFAVAILGLIVLRRRDRLVTNVLGHRSPEVPRAPMREALTTPRPIAGKRYAIPVLRSVVVLFALTIAAVDALVAYLLISAFNSQRIAESREEIAAVERFFALTVENWQFWAVVLGLNAGLTTLLVMMIYQIRKLRDMPDVH